MPDSKSPLSFSLDLAVSGKGARRCPLTGRNPWPRPMARLVWLGEQARTKSLELLGVPARTDDLRAAKKAANAIKRA